MVVLISYEDLTLSGGLRICELPTAKEGVQLANGAWAEEKVKCPCCWMLKPRSTMKPPFDAEQSAQGMANATFGCCDPESRAAMPLCTSTVAGPLRHPNPPWGRDRKPSRVRATSPRGRRMDPGRKFPPGGAPRRTVVSHGNLTVTTSKRVPLTYVMETKSPVYEETSIEMTTTR